tara:strand:- start:185 stop:331 length:147 start_codon:yes stop_codon:yes gene_type:complete
MEQQKMIGFSLFGGDWLWFGFYMALKPYMTKSSNSFTVLNNVLCFNCI